MTADLIRELHEIQRYAAGLHDLLAHASAHAPGRAEGTDRSGTVRVMLGSDGLPETIRVHGGWQRRLAPDAFGAAVGEAFSAATGDRLASWTTALGRNGWQAAVDRLRVGVDQDPPTTGPAPPALRRPVRPVRPVQPRPLDAVAEDVISALDRADRLTAPPAAANGTGSAASGRLSLTLSASGRLSCAADPQWLSRQSAAALMTALSEALQAARSDLARATAGERDTAAAGNATGRLDGLLDEAFALLHNPLTALHRR